MCPFMKVSRPSDVEQGDAIGARLDDAEVERLAGPRRLLGALAVGDVHMGADGADHPAFGIPQIAGPVEHPAHLAVIGADDAEFVLEGFGVGGHGRVTLLGGLLPVLGTNQRGIILLPKGRGASSSSPRLR